MTRAGLLLTVAVLVLAGLYYWARPAPQPMPAPPSPAAGASAASSTAVADAVELSFEIAGGKVAGPPVLAAVVGQRLTLRVRSDEADELHVHGYDLSAPLPAGEEVALTFVAARAGRFEVELHRSHRELGALEVRPR